MTTQEIINARTNAKALSSLAGATMENCIEGAISRSYAMKGYSLSDEVAAEIRIAVRELSPRVMMRWPFLTPGEIVLAFEAGVCGDYGTDKRLNVANYIAWLNAYVRSDERREAIESMTRKVQTKPEYLLPASDIEQRNNTAIVKGLRQAWASFKLTGELGVSTNIWAGTMADWLLKTGKMNPTKETFSRAAMKHKKPSQDIADIIKEGVSNADMATKRELLEMYFKNLIDRNVEFTL